VDVLLSVSDVSQGQSVTRITLSIRGPNAHIVFIGLIARITTMT